MSRENQQIIFSERPTGEIVIGKTLIPKKVPAPTEADLQDGQLLVESLYLSLDPAMRGWMMAGRSYVKPLEIGDVMRGGVVSRVLASKSEKAKAGDFIYAGTGWQEIAITSDAQIRNLSPLPRGARLTDALGVLGMTGLTAYFGLNKIGHVKKGDTVVVSGAAGATGSIAGQIAKLQGAGSVIGIAGSEDKCRWLTEELGFDIALNYKDADFSQKLKDATPNYIDVFWDNVGGDILDAVLARSADNARFVMCGAISQYNLTERQGIKNLWAVVKNRIRLEGFIVFDYLQEYGPALQELAQWLAEGKLKRKETIIKGGLLKAEEGLLQLYAGVNTGKLIVEVKNPDEPKL